MLIDFQSPLKVGDIYPHKLLISMDCISQEFLDLFSIFTI